MRNKFVLLAVAVFIGAFILGCVPTEPLNIGVHIPGGIHKYDKSVSLYFDQSLKNAILKRSPTAKYSTFGDTLASEIEGIINHYFQNVKVVTTRSIGNSDFLMVFSIQQDTCDVGVGFGAYAQTKTTDWWCRLFGKFEVLDASDLVLFMATMEGDKHCHDRYSELDIKTFQHFKIIKQNGICAVEGAVNSFLSEIVSNIEENAVFQK